MQSNASFWEAVLGAGASLRSSKLRSFLTLLGIILATTTLIAVMSVINGMNHYIAENVSDMGADGFRVHRMVMIGQFDPKKYLEMQRRNPELSREEFDFLKSHATMLQDLGMESDRQTKVHYGNQQVDGVDINGVTSNMATLADVQVTLGRFLSESEDQRRQQVAFIGADIYTRFFPSANPLGKTLLIEGRPFDIVGVAKAKGSVFGESLDNFVMIPVETYFKIASFPLPQQLRMTLPNAKNAGYFDLAGDGEYKLNAVGHNLVAHSMPRGASKASGATKRPKRGKAGGARPKRS